MNTANTNESKVVASLTLPLAASVTLIFLLAFIAYAKALSPEAPFMDTLRFLNFFDDSETGVRSLWETWNQGEHRGILPQAVVFWNAKLFGLHLLGATMLSGVAIAATAFALILEIRRTVEHEIAFWLLALLTLGALFSLSNWQLYAVDVGAALFLKNLSFVLYWIALDRALIADRPFLRAGVIASGPAIVLLVAFGWAYAFVITSILCMALAGNRQMTAFKSTAAISLLGALAVYLIAGQGKTQFDPGELTASYATGALSTLYSAGSAFIGTETLQRLALPYVVVVPFGLLLLLLSAFAIWRFARAGGPMIPVALILYGCLHAAAVAYARGRYWAPMAMAPRYYMDLSLAVVGLAWWMMVTKTVDVRLKAATVVMVAAFAIGQATTVWDEMKMTTHRHQAFLRMKAATLRGIPTPADAALVEQEITIAQRAAQIQRDRALGAFRK